MNSLLLIVSCSEAKVVFDGCRLKSAEEVKKYDSGTLGSHGKWCGGLH